VIESPNPLQIGPFSDRAQLNDSRRQNRTQSSDSAQLIHAGAVEVDPICIPEHV
jgi:hypothetical protein